MAEDNRRKRMWSSRRRIEGQAVRVQVSMSEQERAQLIALEQRTGLSASALLVESVFGNADPVAVQLRQQQLSELIQMRRLMATVANNVNQIARHANGTGELLPEATATVREAREFGQRVLVKIEDLTP